ncbi:MAG: hypothetical protein U0Y96_13905 [Candidatus Kapaibacterium sp.]|nr:hypothetical protein [Bacteroidota bacterium]
MNRSFFFTPTNHISQNMVNQYLGRSVLDNDSSIFNIDFLKERRLNSVKYNNAWKKVKETVITYCKNTTVNKSTELLKNSVTQSYKFQSEPAHILDVNDNPIFTSLILYSEKYIAFTIVNVKENRTVKVIEISKETGKVVNSPYLDITIPIKVDNIDEANELNTLIFTAWLGVAFLEEKYKAKQTHSTTKSKGNTLQSGKNCVTHDLKCSNMGIVGIFPDGGWKLWFPCVGTFMANVSDCCKKHDIAMWCSKNEWDRIAADASVVQCVTEKVIDAATSAMPNWCKVFGSTAAVILFFSFSIRFQIIFFLFGIGYPPYLLNYDGRNSNSCLCGGTEPTVQCDDQCRDLCIEMNKRQDCFPCGWKCIYDDNFRPIRVEYISAPDGQNCCPRGTRDCAGTAEEALRSCPQKCSHCYTECGVDPQGIRGYHRYLVNPGKRYGLPCCVGTPSVSIKEPCPPIPDPFGRISSGGNNGFI